MEEPQDKDPSLSGQGPDKNLSPVIYGQEYCSQCGCVLLSHKCKLVCECGYFMSCSDL